MTSHDDVMPRLLCQRHLFDIPEDVAYLNCAYMSPLLRRVTEAGQRAVARKAHPWDITPADFFSEVAVARRRFAELLGDGGGRAGVGAHAVRVVGWKRGRPAQGCLRMPGASGARSR